MAQHNEKPFEDEFCAHLSNLDPKTWQPLDAKPGSWLYSPTDDGYDRARALFPEDLFAWLQDTQPAELAKVVKPTAGEAEQRASRDALLDRLVKILDSPLESGGGTLNVLRRGFKHTPARFDMCQPKPDTSKNVQTGQRYNKVRLRVMRQVHYSLSQPLRSIDLVLFVNGLPVATVELKTDFTQTVLDAIAQYKRDRQPRDPVTKKTEPLLGFGTRALVHFAVSNDEVWMTTRLAGEDTAFLPFNRGRDGGAGNPLNPTGSPSAYLWEQVLQRDAWLHIINKFLVIETKIDRDPDTGIESRKVSLVFPRYHQWEVVTQLVEAARREGPGQRYLIQHSAGSGKTNSIAWTTHQLASLHGVDDAPVFDGVIVISDRTVLDSQLQDAIMQIDHKSGVVEAIDGPGGHGLGPSSKSGRLAQALLAGRRIIVCTLQTFPFAMEEISRNGSLSQKRFAVIADEAHSSQTGATANKLKQVLTADELKEIEEGGEVDTEALLAAEMTARADNLNLSYFAFTATPKGKTLELFGRKSNGGLPQPFHVYTMQQAIEEEFILDVLLNYTSYKTAFLLAQNAESQETVDESQATRSLLRWVKLHPTNIAQKVAIIVEHFRENVEPLLGGEAKAMVVTDSRKAAVRYKTKIDDYIRVHKYQLKTLVAFSGDVDDEESGPGPHNERTMNKELRGRGLREAFATREYRIMLVANKFQTGFDQPKLVAMYVDRQLSGVTAVQTLSRLNRKYPGKLRTFVLDFVNDPDEILKAFLPYYRQATLTTATDPNLVHDLQMKLDAAGIYTNDEIEALVDAYVRVKGNNALAAAVGPAKQRFRDRYASAVAHNRKDEIEALDLFRRDLGTFVRLYDFTSQIIDYGDTDLEKRSIYYRLLERQIRAGAIIDPLDLSGLELRASKQVLKGEQRLDLSSGESTGLRGITAAGSATSRDPKLVRMEEILSRLNELFADEDFSEAQKTSWLESLFTALLADKKLIEQAKTNSRSQFLESPDLTDGVTSALLDTHSAHSKILDRFTADDRVRADLIRGLGELVHEQAGDAA
ncbi:MAG: restriction endonuclease subunit [Frankiales bacterium]|nr:restriction endonuclease subunit [Frankiales bacterium]